MYGEGESKNTVDLVGDSRIKYKGCVSRDEIVSVEKAVYALVNPRPTYEEYSKCSFPSKLLEYMLSGTFVLTTKLESMPEEYYDKLEFIESSSESDIKKALEKCSLLSEEYVKNIASKAKEFILTQKTPMEQARKIQGFIERCNLNGVGNNKE